MTVHHMYVMPLKVSTPGTEVTAVLWVKVIEPGPPKEQPVFLTLSRLSSPERNSTNSHAVLQIHLNISGI